MSGIAAWLDNWARAIRERDFAGARPLFAEDVMAFGSLSSAMTDRDTLEHDQWRPIWSRTRGFRFDDWAVISDQEGEAVVACTWSSEGDGGAGKWYPRQGRATLVLRQQGDGYVCIHSHFSMMPGTEPLQGREALR